MSQQSKPAEQIVTVLAELLPDENALVQRAPAALIPARQVQAELIPQIEANPAYVPLWQMFQADPHGQSAILISIVQTLLASDADLARRMDTLLTAYYAASAATGSVVQTGGGDYYGQVQVENGDFVRGNKTHVVGSGNVVGNNNVVNSHNTTTSQQGLSADEATRLFERALALAQTLPPAVKDDVETAVETVQEETAAGESADKRLLSKMLDLLLEKAPDVLEIVVEAILNPGAAAGKGARMLASQIRETLRKQSKS